MAAPSTRKDHSSLYDNMGKSKKVKVVKSSARNLPLSQQITEDSIAKPSQRIKGKSKPENEDKYVDEKLSRKILEQARLQQEELEEEHGVASSKKPLRPTVRLGREEAPGSEDEDSASEELSEDEHEYYDHVEVDEEDERALQLFMSRETPARRDLADIIRDKLTEKQTEIATQLDDGASIEMSQLDDRVVQMYRGVRDILSRYRGGKLPKAFKIIPSLTNWEQILYITEPDNWSAAAMYQACRIFVSNLNAKMAQRFFNLVLLPRVRDDIAEYKRLNFHLYMALKKSLFKPAAFYKGVLLPLCEAGTCTLREAIIVASVIARCSIPVLHSSAAILKIAEMDYNGANSIFLRTLFEKKYALPYRVIDAVVFHYLRFRTDRRQLPVLWHQSLLTFMQRYKEDLSTEQKEQLRELLRAQTHEPLTSEIRRELAHARCRDTETADMQME